jgi:hypothetical protein
MWDEAGRLLDYLGAVADDERDLGHGRVRGGILTISAGPQ